MITKFSPGHDARIHVEQGDVNATTLEITLEFNMPMDCATITAGVSFNMSSSGHGGNPTISGTPTCGTVTNPDPARIQNSDLSEYFWTATLQNVPDGILTITVANPQTTDHSASTGVRIRSF